MAEKPEEQGDKEPAPTKDSDASTVSQEEAEQAPGSQQDPDEDAEQAG
jgi:hypothetical protein